MTGDGRLAAVLGVPELAWLVARVRQRLSQGRPPSGSVTLTGATAAQRRAAELLLGRAPGRGTSLTVSLDHLDTVVRRSGLHPQGLAGAVTTLTGPVEDAVQARAAAVAAWADARRPVETLVGERPILAQWYADIAGTGLLRRVCGTPKEAGPLLVALVAVLRALPADGMTLARFAAGTTGDAHGLDQGRPLSTLALSAIRAGWWSDDGQSRSPAVLRRALWSSVGVVVDDLSSTVLTLNLRPESGTVLAALVGPAAAMGEPAWLTLRQLTRFPVTLAPEPTYVCENPAVLAAVADRFGADAPTVVCVNGQPTGAVLALLAAAHRSGAPVRYHGDFDWGGVRIANLLRTHIAWMPWRYDVASYRAAVAVAGPLRGRPVEARWDSALRAAMVARGQRVEEESQLDELLADLAS